MGFSLALLLLLILPTVAQTISSLTVSFVEGENFLNTSSYPTILAALETAGAGSTVYSLTCQGPSAECGGGVLYTDLGSGQFAVNGFTTTEFIYDNAGQITTANLNVTASVSCSPVGSSLIQCYQTIGTLYSFVGSGGSSQTTGLTTVNAATLPVATTVVEVVDTILSVVLFSTTESSSSAPDSTSSTTSTTSTITSTTTDTGTKISSSSQPASTTTKNNAVGRDAASAALAGAVVLVAAVL
jgi:hypothetical protein